MRGIFFTSNEDFNKSNEASNGVGHLPYYSLIIAIGLVIIAIADTFAREGNQWADIFYWTGLFIIFTPVLLRLLSPNVSLAERIGLILILGLGFYCVKLLYSPLEFKYPDELQHWRTENNILQTNHLFTPNPGLPISPLYPGLQIVTNAFTLLSGLPIFQSGVILIAIARIIQTLAMFFLFKEIGKSERVAGIASLIYMVNPHYLFIDSFFIYQTLGLALLTFCLYLIAKGENYKENNQIGLKIILIFTIIAVIVTHHVTSYALIAFLFLWLFASAIIRLHNSRQILPVSIFLLAFIETITWSILVNPTTVYYFGPSVSNLAGNILSLITQDAGISSAFRAPIGPMIDRFFNIGSVGLVALFLVPAMWITWRKYRLNALALSLVIGSFGYYGVLLVRFISSQGSELAGRSWSFIFYPVAFVLAVGVCEISNRWVSRRVTFLLTSFFFMFVFIGGIMGGEPPYYERLPGPYLVGSYERAIEPQGVSDAKWAATYLGSNNRISSDYVNYTLMGSYGNQDPVRAIYSIFYSLGRFEEEINEIRYYSVRYLVVDKRIASMIPASGRYFDVVDPHTYKLKNPIDIRALTKFDSWQDIDRIFDSGDIVIYDLKRLSNEN